MYLKNLLINSEQITDLSLAIAVIESQEVRLNHQEKHIAKLEERISYLEKNSGNSSKPPSSDIVKPPSEQRQKGKRHAGGQSRHKGNYRLPYLPEEVDRVVEPELLHCPVCSGAVILSSENAARIIQQAELVSKPVEFTEYRLNSYYCPKCNRYHRAGLPVGVDERSICGVRLQSCISYLKGSSCISYNELRLFLREVFCFKISTGGLSNLVNRVSESLLPAYNELGIAIRNEPLLHIDETGWKDNGFRHWVWLCCNDNLAYFHISDSRGAKVLQELLGDNFSGAVVSDFYSAYVKLGNIKQQFCLAHLIRDIKFLTTLPCVKTKAFGDKLLIHFANIFKIWHRKNEVPIDELKIMLNRRVTRLRNFLSRDKDREDHIHKMKKRFNKHWSSLFRFVQEPEIYEPTNNLAEQTLRIATRIRYLTQGTRSGWGQHWWSRILSVIGTCKKKKISAYRFINDAINAKITGEIYPVLLQT